MIGRQIHKLKVRNKATGEISERQVENSGTIEDAKKHIGETPPSRGAPLGFEVIEDSAPVVETK